jgi:hypothetical protein
VLAVAKILQGIGLVDVGIGLVYGIAGGSMWVELGHFLVGSGIFGVGWWIGRRAAR